MNVSASPSILVLLLAVGCSQGESGNDTTFSTSMTTGVATTTGGTCGAGQRDCNGDCVDVDADPEHCGGCDNACAMEESCVAGTCTTACAGETTDCDGECVDTQADAAHCGGCGIACGPDEVCSQGSCASSCEAGLMQCGESCIDVSSNAMHCGGCDAPCEAGETCVAGQCSDVCQNGRLDGMETDVDCGGPDCSPCQLGEACQDGSDCVTFSCTDLACSHPPTCAAIKAEVAAARDGAYTIDPDSEGGTLPYQVYCDMTTDGGGWLLVLAYAHVAGENNPLMPGLVPGDPSTGYSHMSLAQLQGLTFSEIRLYCETSAHPRKVHFRTGSAAVDYFRGTGTNAANLWSVGFFPLTGHDAFLPAAVDNGFNQTGEDRMTNFPFYLGGTYHWGIRGLDARWECDDYPGTGDNTTLHQVWVR